jgi:hypothetical protein
VHHQQVAYSSLSQKEEEEEFENIPTASKSAAPNKQQANGAAIKAAPALNEGEIAFQSQASEPWPWLLLKMTLAVVAVAVIYTACEGWDDIRGGQEDNGERRRFGVVKSLYFATATATTIGYGDVYPKTDLGRACAIVYMPLSIYVFGNAVGAVAQVRC